MGSVVVLNIYREWGIVILMKDSRDIVFDLVGKATCCDFNRREPWKHIGEMVARLNAEDKQALAGMTSDYLATDVRWARDVLKKDAS